jgi:hypothetical protein
MPAVKDYDVWLFVQVTKNAPDGFGSAGCDVDGPEKGMVSVVDFWTILTATDHDEAFIFSSSLNHRREGNGLKMAGWKATLVTSKMVMIPSFRKIGHHLQNKYRVYAVVSNCQTLHQVGLRVDTLFSFLKQIPHLALWHRIDKKDFPVY